MALDDTRFRDGPNWRQKRAANRYIGASPVRFAFRDWSGEGLLVNLSLQGALIRVAASPRPVPRDLDYWQPGQIESPLKLHVRVVRVETDSSGTYIGVKWRISRRQINALAIREESAELLYDGTEKPRNQADTASFLVEVNSLIDARARQQLARNPEALYDLSSRAFEELVASVLNDFGMEVELTKATRDGGVDIYAYVRNRVASFLVIAECKNWRPPKRVGIEIVQRLYGIQQSVGANKSLVITTSYFTSPAEEECRLYKGQMELKDFDELKLWLVRYAQ